MYLKSRVTRHTIFGNFIFPSFKTSHTTLFWFLGDTQGARFYGKHGTTLHLFVMLFPVQYMEKRFALETRAKKAFLIKNERSTKTSVCGRKKKRENIFSDSQWCLCFGYGAENKICSIKETQAFCFILFRSGAKQSKNTIFGVKKIHPLWGGPWSQRSVVF